MSYASYYIASNGQPINGYATHTSKREAIARARSLKANLPQHSGGRAVAVVVNDDPTREPECLYSWYEHFNGGYRTI